MKFLWICFFVVATPFSVADVHDPEVTKIMSKNPGFSPGQSRVRLYVRDEIPLSSWVNCNYYSVKEGMLDSTNHVLLKRIIEWTVEAPPGSVDYAICFVPRSN